MELCAYVYADRERHLAPLGSVALHQPATLYLVRQQAKYWFWMEGSAPISMPRGATADAGWSYLTGPYFGGDETAPHTIRIRIRREE